MSDFTALVVREADDGSFSHALETRSTGDLPPHDTLVRVQWSSLNYKDALSFSGNKGITRQYPHTPGVDAAGVIVESPVFEPGTEVIVVGFDLGMNTSGALAEFIRVPSAWVLPKPPGLSLRECMILGTAGFTAAQSLYRFRQSGLATDKGDVLVTSATGGVGCVAVALLARAGYRVVAASRRPADAEWLRGLGAAEVIDAATLLEDSGKPMLRGRWAGAVDTVGGKTLEVLTRSMQHRGVLTCCGMITGAQLHTNVFPFILRGLTLIGIDSAECPIAMKKEIWNLLGADWRCDALGSMAREIGLAEAPDHLRAMLNGGSRGRVLVRI